MYFFLHVHNQANGVTLNIENRLLSAGAPPISPQ